MFRIPLEEMIPGLKVNVIKKKKKSERNKSLIALVRFLPLSLPSYHKNYVVALLLH